MSNTELQKELEETKARLKKLEDILLGTNNDTRFISKVRDAVFDNKEHSTGKPIVVNKFGKRFNLEIV